MSRGQGRAYQRGNVWWLDYSVNGARFRGPTTAATGNETLSGGLRTTSTACARRSAFSKAGSRSRSSSPPDARDGDHADAVG